MCNTSTRLKAVSHEEGFGVVVNYARAAEEPGWLKVDRKMCTESECLLLPFSRLVRSM